MKIQDKVSETITQLTNQVSELAKTLSRMEHQQASVNSSNNVFDKKKTNLELSQYFRPECIEIVVILYETYKQNACEFINLATRALLNPNCLEACHPLVSEGKNKIL